MAQVPTKHQVRERVREFIVQKFPAARKLGLTGDAELLEGGLLDSLGILDLVQFIETEFAVHISDEELIPENFRNLDQIAGFIREKSVLNPNDGGE